MYVSKHLLRKFLSSQYVTNQNTCFHIHPSGSRTRSVHVIGYTPDIVYRFIVACDDFNGRNDHVDYSMLYEVYHNLEKAMNC